MQAPRPTLRSVNPFLASVTVSLVSVVLAFSALGLPADLALAAAPETSAGPSNPAMSPAIARQLLALPAGSVSMGGTSSGRLIRAAALPLRGPHHAFFPHIAARGMFYGTDEMAGFLRRVAARVAVDHPRTKVRLGNVSQRQGGRSQWHASHQVGRDVDIAFFVTDERGRPVVLDDFVKLNRRGLSYDGRLRFDLDRNLSLVQAMLADVDAPAQWVFVARWLEKLLLDHAEDEGVEPEIRRKLAELMRQPGDSTPHNDHYHVRIYCSLEDRKYGCLNREPWRDWVDMQDGAWQEHVEQVGRVLDLPDARLRLRAVRLMERIRAAPAVPRLVTTLTDRDPGVRQAALRAIETIGEPTAAEGLLGKLRQTDDPRWAASLFEVYETLEHDGLPAAARRLIERPATMVSRKIARGHIGPLQVQAAEVLGERGRKEAVKPLLKLLSSPSPAVRLAAHEALGQVTNMRVRGNPASRRSRTHKAVARKWQQFWRKNHRSSWLKWTRLGFRSHGVAVSRRRYVERDIPRLIRAIRHRNPAVSRNAMRVLTALTGHEFAPHYRNRRREIRRQTRHWRWWYRRHKGRAIRRS